MISSNVLCSPVPRARHRSGGLFPGRGRQRILSLGPGDILGWSPLFEKATMVASAITLTETELCGIPVHELRDLCDSDHEIGYYFMREVAKALGRRLLATRLQLLDLFGNGESKS